MKSHHFTLYDDDCAMIIHGQCSLSTLCFVDPTEELKAKATAWALLKEHLRPEWNEGLKFSHADVRLWANADAKGRPKVRAAPPVVWPPKFELQIRPHKCILTHLRTSSSIPSALLHATVPAQGTDPSQFMVMVQDPLSYNIEATVNKVNPGCNDLLCTDACKFESGHRGRASLC